MKYLEHVKRVIQVCGMIAVIVRQQHTHGRPRKQLKLQLEK